MNKLSFKNFRGFIDFPEMEFDGVTFLVGKNNSGKSTAIKALLLIIDYLKSDNASRFSFDNGKLGDYANIKTFERAKNKYTSDNFIEFTLQMNDFKFVIKVYEMKTMYFGNSFALDVYDVENGFLGKLNNSYGSGSITINFEAKSIPTLEDGFLEIDTKRVFFNAMAINAKKVEYSPVIEVIRNYEGFVNNLDIQYFRASLPKQNSLLNINDKDNSLSQAVHEYFQSDVGKFDNTAKLLLLKWLQKDKFDIGEEIKIECIEGEAYKVTVKREEQWVSIADKGMGTLQLLTILLRLSCLIHRSIYSYSINYSPIIIFEEPELNLHPALQSKLADLFYEVHTLSKGEIQIIVETHSEYIIRRSQVLVAENKLETQPNQNPFKIYYFNDEGGHYRMNYRTDGIFIEDFGSGFYDVASTNAMQLFKLNKN